MAFSYLLSGVYVISKTGRMQTSEGMDSKSLRIRNRHGQGPCGEPWRHIRGENTGKMCMDPPGGASIVCKGDMDTTRGTNEAALACIARTGDKEALRWRREKRRAGVRLDDQALAELAQEVPAVVEHVAADEEASLVQQAIQGCMGICFHPAPPPRLMTMTVDIGGGLVMIPSGGRRLFGWKRAYYGA
jgi:hypothetical protein